MVAGAGGGGASTAANTGGAGGTLNGLAGLPALNNPTQIAVGQVSDLSSVAGGFGIGQGSSGARAAGGGG